MISTDRVRRRKRGDGSGGVVRGGGVRAMRYTKRLSWVWARRRGVVSVLSMMFLILFGSLAAAMAIMSRGNITTAATHLHVNRAQGAAETGLAVARRRLQEGASRFIVEKGTVDSGFGERLWSGNFLISDGTVNVIAPSTYSTNLSNPRGMAEAVAQIHQQDSNTVVVNNITAPTIGPAPAGTDPSVFLLTDWLRTPAVALTAQSAGGATNTAFQIDYAPLANGTQIRVMVTGYDFDYSPRGQPVRRRIIQDFTMVKRVNAAVVSPSKIMIGKNVTIEGDLGSTFTDVTHQYGDPLIVKSDFWGIENNLNAQLTLLFNALATYDHNQDNRLRVGHPTESPGIPDFSGLPGYNGSPDVTGDGYVDEFDVFMLFYDKNGDGKVGLPTAISAGTPNSGVAPEMVNAGGTATDPDLALMVDSGIPDRNRNKVYSFTDNNSNGKFDPGTDELDDREQVNPGSVPQAYQSYIHVIGGLSYVFRDQVLGFRDGVIDKRDQYAKVSGKLMFRVTESAWATAQGDYMQRLRGPIDPEEGESPMTFGATVEQLPDMTSANFTNSQTALRSAADGAAFDEQVAANLGIAVGQLATWVPANNSAVPTDPKFYPLSPDADADGLPDNWQTAYFEKMPFNSPSYSDWYYRPVYENMTFKNVQIPIGNNGLFKNCTFAGVTFVRARTSNDHINWTIYGKLRLDATSGKPVLDPPRTTYLGSNFPAMLAGNDRPVLMANPPLDKADIPDNQIGSTQGYANLPDPLIINGYRCIDSKKFSNNIRFHGCLFVGSVVGDAPQEYTNARNKLQFTGGTRFVEQNPDYPNDPNKNPDPGDLPEIKKSSLMLPNYSVDIGQFNSPPTQDVRLKGAVVAGVLDVRGNASIDGALLLTFKPVLGLIPLRDALGNPVGNPATFNTTLGYFGPADGDDESLDPETLPIVGGVKIVGWDLDGDGLPDLGPNTPPTAAQTAAGAVTVPFYGYGGVTLRFDPSMLMPDGILMPLQVDTNPATYRETAK
ncbi:MAG: hypothetical protein ACKVW3_06680 [Phycisphaerales bacterium]